jgi:hypothetical protein
MIFLLTTPLRVPFGVLKVISEPVVHSAQAVHLSCLRINTISKRTDTSFYLTIVTYKYHRVCLKKISMLVVHSVQTVHLSCVEINTISKRSEISFHLTNVT